MWPLHLLGSPDLSYSSTNTAEWNQRSYFLNSFHHKFMIPAFHDYSLEPKTRNLGTSCVRRWSRKKYDRCIYSAQLIWVTQAQILFCETNEAYSPNFHDYSLEPKITKYGDLLYKTAEQEEMWPLHLLGSPDLSYSSTNTVQWNQRSLLTQFFSSQKKKKIGSCKSVRKQFQNKKLQFFYSFSLLSFSTQI